jgi:hypothetical protein
MNLKRFTKKNDLVTRCIGGETVIVPVEGHVGDLDAIYTLNEAGSTIWALIDGKTSVSQIVEAVRNQYDVTLEEAQKDVMELIDSLEAAGLIHKSDED